MTVAAFNYPFRNSPLLKYLIFSTFFSFLILFSSCAPSTRYTNKKEVPSTASGTAIRVLLQENENNFTYIVKNNITVRSGDKKLALVKTGNSLQFIPGTHETTLKIGSKTFQADYFLLEGEDNSPVADLNGKVYSGSIKIFTSGNKINVINTIALEEYVKGVLPSEMPVGKGEVYLESFKAFAICARTYAINRMQDGKSLFDIYADTRDQVYGGSGKGNAVSDRAVDETSGMIMTYNNEPAIIFYHSTCGGSTEKVDNVFAPKNIPYLQGVKDGENSYCVDSPRFRWEEKFEASLFIRRLYEAKLLPHSSFKLNDIKIKSRFDSGRINELQISVSEGSETPKIISLHGNGMRSVIRTADNSTILRSNFFDINFDGKIINISGRGYGHGVGLCQWGSMYMSAHDKDYKEILSHYYPGTTIKNIND